jgi:protein-tyrosine kinase
MEKLQQAMEKARQQRTGQVAGGKPPPRPRPFGAMAGQGLIDPAKAQPVTFSDGLLRSNKIVAHLMDGQQAWSGQRRAVEAFRMVRTRAAHALQAESGPSSVFAVTSPRQGDGKTLVAINLAIGLARQPGSKVLLVDGDLRLPSIAKVLGLEAKLGLSDYLAGRATLEGCLLAAPGGGLFIIPQVGSLPQSSELLANGVLAAFLQTMREQHPDWLVMIDCPPILAVDDTLVILQAVDKALLVVREGYTRRNEMRRAAAAIGEAKYLGTVLNDSRSAGDRGQHYYYDYGYEKR